MTAMAMASSARAHVDIAGTDVTTLIAPLTSVRVESATVSFVVPA